MSSDNPLNPIPTTFQIKQLTAGNGALFEKLVELFHHVFEMERGLEHRNLTALLGRPGFIVFVAMNGGKVAGGITAYEMPMYYGNYSELYIYDLAVQVAYQRMGAGKQLLAALSAYCKQNGIKEMFVEAHEEDAHAVEFYRSAGGTPEQVVHFNFSF